MQDSDIAELIADTKLAIKALSDAIIFLATNPTLSYMLDTGQSEQRKTNANLSELRASRSALINECDMLEARLTGSNVVIGGPAF